MYLPDPRYEVVVKRKLSKSECELMYPGNLEALKYNSELNEKSIQKKVVTTKTLNNYLTSTVNQEDSLAIFESNANISRGTSYTKLRTITLDTKYEGVVSIRVFDGYAISIVSTEGNKRTVIGPETVLLNYNEAIESVQTQEEKTGYLKIKNNIFNFSVVSKTKDYENFTITGDLIVNFIEENKDNWFSVENIPMLLSQYYVSIVKKIIINYNSIEILKDVNAIKQDILNEFNKINFINGMKIIDCNIFAIPDEGL